MQLLIKVENNQPVNHPILFENFLMINPDADYDNLPEGYVKFIRVPRPFVGPFQTTLEQPVYIWNNGVVTDDWGVRDMTLDEKAACIANTLLCRPYPSWTFIEEELRFEPPVPVPQDGKIYNWDEDTLSWIEYNRAPNP